MQIERFHVPSKMDDLNLSILLVRPDDKPKAVLQILHGMCEHKERYLLFMEYLTNHQIAAIIHDHRGHGESVRQKKDLGYMYRNGTKAIVEDARQIHQMVRKQFSDIPCYIMGHSMGALVARAYLKKYEQEIDGLILCGCPSKYDASRLAMHLAKISGVVFGERARAKRITRMMFAHHNDKFKNVTTANAWICANRSTVEQYNEEEYCGFTFTYNGMYNLCKLMTTVYDKKHWHMNNKKLPIWCISGKEDPFMISNKKFNEAVDSLRQVGYEDVTYKIYKGMRHEILNEYDREIVYQDILAKLNVWELSYSKK